jgi:hypothetical protein
MLQEDAFLAEAKPCSPEVGRSRKSVLSLTDRGRPTHSSCYSKARMSFTGDAQMTGIARVSGASNLCRILSSSLDFPVFNES